MVSFTRNYFFLLSSGRNEEPFRLMFDALIFSEENESAEDFQLVTCRALTT